MMDVLDKKLETMLTSEEKTELAGFREQGPIAQAFGIFGGESGWIGWVAILLSLGVIVVAVIAIVQILSVDTAISAVRWGVVLVLAFVSQMMIKQWSWMRMESNRLMREIQRLEMLVLMRN